MEFNFVPMYIMKKVGTYLKQLPFFWHMAVDYLDWSYPCEACLFLYGKLSVHWWTMTTSFLKLLKSNNRLFCKYLNELLLDNEYISCHEPPIYNCGVFYNLPLHWIYQYYLIIDTKMRSSLLKRVWQHFFLENGVKN